jgi:hypothetical protein
MVPLVPATGDQVMYGAPRGAAPVEVLIWREGSLLAFSGVPVSLNATELALSVTDSKAMMY